MIGFFQQLQAQQLGDYLPSYISQYRPEKLHMHFDKSAYNRGETIWYKSYIVTGGRLSDFSRNFYVDWYDQLGKLLTHTVQPVFESSARGQFDIPSSYKGERIYLKAYTQWMLNFDSSFIFKREIIIAQQDSMPKFPFAKPIASIRFFPEGGDLVNGVNSNLAFIANNQSGEPVMVRGGIFNNANQLIDSFTTTHDGMGKLSIEPSAKETYYANWLDEYGISHVTDLPTARTGGVALETVLKSDKAVFVLKRSPEMEDRFKQVHLIATINQQLVFNASINLGNKKVVTGQIPLDSSIQTGVLQITAFDANWVPLSERVLFVKNPDFEFFPKLQVTGKRLTKRAKNTIEINVYDSVLSNLSISITDARLFQDSSSNIFSQLLLSEDIKGYIYNPAYYFNDDNETVNAHLDLVMMTHGWRRYKWDEIAKGGKPEMKYSMDSDYLQIRGVVSNNGQSASHANQTLTLVMQARDSSKQYFNVPIKPDGTFKQRGIIFFDSSRVYYQINNDKKLNNIATVNFQYSLPDTRFARQMQVKQYRWLDTSQLKETNIFYAGANRTKKTMDSTVILKEVIVNSKVKTRVDILDEMYSSGLFTSKNGYAFDVLADNRAKGATDVFHYLQEMVPGLTMSIPIFGANGAEDANSNKVPGLNWREGSPDLFLNEMPTDAGAIMDLSMSQVAYIKVFRPPFMGASGSGPSGAIVIYTRKAGDIKTTNVKGLNSVLINGYTAYREFYQPDYTTLQSKYADTRATLYWNPYILTDKKNKTVRFEFFNNDVTNRFRVVLEGVNANGKLARIEKIIE